jgi:hypothetical protein
MNTKTTSAVPAVRRFAVSLAVTAAMIVTAPVTTGCASLHHYEVGEIDSTEGRLTPFELQVDETGVDVHQAISIAESVSTERSKKRLDKLDSAIALFQVGPSTGNPTFNETWADGLVPALRERCPSGRITGVSTVRETTSYPVVSGEIVTIKGYCIQ